MAGTARGVGFAGAASLVAAALAYSVWDVRPLPVGLVRIVDSGARAIDVRGGAEMTLRPAAGDEPQALVRRVVEYARVDGLEAEAAPGAPGAVVDVTGDPARVDRFVHELAPFTMEVVDDGSDFMRGLAAEVDRDPRARALGVSAKPDSWSSEASDVVHQDFFLAAADPERIARYLHERSVDVPPRHALLFEHVYPRSSNEDVLPWRTVLVWDEPVLDGAALSDADVFWDPSTNRPEVLITFTRAGARRFAEITGANVGRKLAMVVNGHVVSAPVIQTTIAGGKSNITMGGGDRRYMQSAAEELVWELRGSMVLGASTVESTRMLAPRAAQGWLVALRAILAVLAGGLVFGVAVLAGRALPIEAVPRAPTAGVATAPALRLAVTLAAVLLLLFRERIPLPFIDSRAFDDLVRNAGVVARKPGLFMLGLAPIVAGFIVVEIVALVVPRWRPLRHGARVELDLHAVAVGLGIALVQGFSFARRLQGTSTPILDAGSGPALLVAVTLVGGTVCLLVLAALVGRYGLGNGIALVIVADLAFRIRFLPDRMVGSAELLSLVALNGVVVLTAWALMRRVRDPSGATVRLPSAGVVPLAYGFVTLVLGSVGVADPFPRNMELWIVLVVLATVVFTWLFWVKPDGPGPRTLLLASALSAVYLLAIGGLASLVSDQAGWSAALLALATAAVLDLVDPGRPAGDGHVRSLLHFFAPWAR